MATERRRIICCCGADVWLKVFAALAYISAILILAIYIPGLSEIRRQIDLLFDSHEFQGDVRTNSSVDLTAARAPWNTVYNITVAFVVIEFVFAFGIASTMLFGTIKKNIPTLWTAVALEGLFMVFHVILLGFIIAGSTDGSKKGADIGRTVIQLLVGVFVIYVICCRVREVKEERENPAERAAVYSS